MLNTDQFEILDGIDLAKTTISYNTNGTLYPSDRLIDLWSRAKLVKIYFSIDAIGPQYEYIRYPGNWNEVSSNLLKMRQELPSNVMFSFNCAVGCYNAFEMIDVWKWFDANMSSNREGDPSDFCWQPANNYDIRHLSSTAKQDIINQVSTIPQLESLTNYVKSVQSHPPSIEWQHSLNAIDKRRGTDWKSTLQIGKYY